MRQALASALRHLHEQGLWVFLGRVYLSGGSLLSSILLARLMTQNDMGTYSLLRSGIGMVAVLSLPGVFEVLIRNIPQGHYGIYGPLFRKRIGAAVLASLAFIGYAVCVNDVLSTAQVISLAVIATLLPLYFSSQMYVAAYQAQMQFRQLSAIYIGRTTVQLLGYLVPFLVFKAVFPALACMIAIMTVYHVWNHRKMHRDLLAKANGEQYLSLGLMRDAGMISLFSILPAVTENIDKVFIEGRIGLAQLAVYSIGMTIGSAINAFFKPFLNSINAKLVHQVPGPQHYALVVVVGTVLGGAVTLALPYLVPFLYGEAYSASVPMAAIVLMSMGLFFGKTLYFNLAMFNKDRKLTVVYASNVTTAIGAIGYMVAVTWLVRDNDTLLLWFAGTYPLKNFLSIFTLWIFPKLLGKGLDG